MKCISECWNDELEMMCYNILDFRTIDDVKKVKVMEALLKDGDMLLFTFSKPNPQGLSDDERVFIFNGYYKGFINYENKNTKLKIDKEIKELLFEYYCTKSNCDLRSKDINTFKEELFKDFFKIGIENIDKALLDKVQNVVLINDCNEEDEINTKFIMDRVKMITRNEAIFPWEIDNDRLHLTYWFSYNNESEMQNSLASNTCFQGIVLNEKNDLRDYSYSIYLDETMSRKFNLEIFEKNKGTFITDVLPKLKKIFYEIKLIKVNID